MATKKELLRDLQAFSPEEIAAAIRSGEVTVYELSRDAHGAFTPLLKAKVKKILTNPQPVDTPAAEPTPAPSLMPQPAPAIPEPESAPAPAPVYDVPAPAPAIPEPEPTPAPPMPAPAPAPVYEEPTPQPSVTPQPFNPNATPGSSAIPQKQSMFSNPFGFKGRIRRLEYGLSILIASIFNGIIQGFFAAGAINNDFTPLVIFGLLLLVPYSWFCIAQNCKRCHDLGHSGWFMLIPFYGFWLLFAEGDRFENEYGPDPKALI